VRLELGGGELAIQGKIEVKHRMFSCLECVLAEEERAYEYVKQVGDKVDETLSNKVEERLVKRTIVIKEVVKVMQDALEYFKNEAEYEVVYFFMNRVPKFLDFRSTEVHDMLQDLEKMVTGKMNEDAIMALKGKMSEVVTAPHRKQNGEGSYIRLDVTERLVWLFRAATEEAEMFLKQRPKPRLTGLNNNSNALDLAYGEFTSFSMFLRGAYTRLDRLVRRYRTVEQWLLIEFLWAIDIWISNTRKTMTTKLFKLCQVEGKREDHGGNLEPYFG